MTHSCEDYGVIYSIGITLHMDVSVGLWGVVCMSVLYECCICTSSSFKCSVWLNVIDIFVSSRKVSSLCEVGMIIVYVYVMCMCEMNVYVMVLTHVNMRVWGVSLYNSISWFEFLQMFTFNLVCRRDLVKTFSMCCYG